MVTNDPSKPAAVCGRRTDRDDLGQCYLAATAPCTGGGTIRPAAVISLPINGRHRLARYGAEVNGLVKRLQSPRVLEMNSFR